MEDSPYPAHPPLPHSWNPDPEVKKLAASTLLCNLIESGPCSGPWLPLCEPEFGDLSFFWKSNESYRSLSPK